MLSPRQPHHGHTTVTPRSHQPWVPHDAAQSPPQTPGLFAEGWSRAPQQQRLQVWDVLGMCSG